MQPSGPSQTSISLLGRLGVNPQDAAAWAEFVQRYGPKVLQWCRHYKLQEADAEDVTQNVLLSVARQMKTFRYDPSRSFRAWLKTIAHRAWCDWLESTKRPGQGSGDSAMVRKLATLEAGEGLIEKLEMQFDIELLDLAMAQVQLRVEPRTWEAFRLLAVEGRSGAAAAEQLGMKVGAVFVAKSKVQKMVQETVRHLEGADQPAADV